MYTRYILYYIHMHSMKINRYVPTVENKINESLLCSSRYMSNGTGRPENLGFIFLSPELKLFLDLGQLYLGLILLELMQGNFKSDLISYLKSVLKPPYRSNIKCTTHTPCIKHIEPYIREINQN